MQALALYCEPAFSYNIMTRGPCVGLSRACDFSWQECNAKEQKDRIRVYPCIAMSVKAKETQCNAQALASYSEPGLRSQQSSPPSTGATGSNTHCPKSSIVGCFNFSSDRLFVDVPKPTFSVCMLSAPAHLSAPCLTFDPNVHKQCYTPKLCVIDNFDTIILVTFYHLNCYYRH